MLQRGHGGISGEVYWVPEPCWPALDDWEEVPEVYQRSSATLRDGRGVWLYEAASSIIELKKVKSTQRNFSHCTFTENKKIMP